MITIPPAMQAKIDSGQAELRDMWAKMPEGIQAELLLGIVEFSSCLSDKGIGVMIRNFMWAGVYAIMESATLAASEDTQEDTPTNE